MDGAATVDQPGGVRAALHPHRSAQPCRDVARAGGPSGAPASSTSIAAPGRTRSRQGGGTAAHRFRPQVAEHRACPRSRTARSNPCAMPSSPSTARHGRAARWSAAPEIGPSQRPQRQVVRPWPCTSGSPAAVVCGVGKCPAHAMVPHQAQQRGAVAQPVVAAQPGRLIGSTASSRTMYSSSPRSMPPERRVRRVVQGVVEVEQPDLRRLTRPPQCDRIIVPWPWSVRISSSIACGTRPSMILHGVGALMAASAPRDLGQHAAADRAVGEQVVDLRAPTGWSAACRSCRARLGVGQQHQLLGLQHLGELAGDDVGVDVVVLVVLAKPSGEITGMNWSSCRAARPTGRSARSRRPGRRRARRSVLQVDHLQLAGADQPAVAAGQAHRLPPPATLIRPTMSCCTSPASTHSTTSIVSASVTRMPWMNCPSCPGAPAPPRSAARRRAPPPGSCPTSLSSTTSSAKSCCRPGRSSRCRRI